MEADEIIAANRYMTLATADTDGVPWASPVWFATEDLRHFYWVSDPNARHSRNIAARPDIALVIFDSTVTPGDGRAVYVAARAEQVDPAELGVFQRVSAAQGLDAWTEERVSAPAKHRLYRATATERYTLRHDIDERTPF
jgi:nitroimidazol reductase NimA-like FMN-containing flavoprotein (pyridoxamine 5'-phosphate oxidase superfamily)